MKDYSLFCTPEQTIKALELGAPIVHYENAYTSKSTPHFYIGEYGNYQKGFILYIIPTAEQMIGFIIESGRGCSTDLSMLIHKQGYKQGCLTFIDSCLK